MTAGETQDVRADVSRPTITARKSRAKRREFDADRAIRSASPGCRRSTPSSPRRSASPAAASTSCAPKSTANLKLELKRKIEARAQGAGAAGAARQADFATCRSRWSSSEAQQPAASGRPADLQSRGVKAEDMQALAGHVSPAGRGARGARPDPRRGRAQRTSCSAQARAGAGAGRRRPRRPTSNRKRWCAGTTRSPSG